MVAFLDHDVSTTDLERAAGRFDAELHRQRVTRASCLFPDDVRAMYDGLAERAQTDGMHRPGPFPVAQNQDVRTVTAGADRVNE